MPSQSKNHLVRTIAFVILILGLLQSSCYKNKEQDDDNSKSPMEELFLKDLQGEWIFERFDRSGYSGIVFSLDFWNDTVYFRNHPDSTYFSYPDSTWARYSIYDPRVYTIPCIEKIQNFTITENNDSLFLEIIDLFGNSSNFHMYYDKFYFHGDDGGGVITSAGYHFNVNMKFVNQDTVMTFTDFQLSCDVLGISIQFSKQDGDFIDRTVLEGSW